MDYDKHQRQDSVYSLKMKAGKRRTYFFDIRRTKGDDYYLTLTESTKKMNGEGYERHKVFLYKEDFNRFMSHLQEVIDYVKTELLPDYDYDEFNRYEEEEYGNEDEGRRTSFQPYTQSPASKQSQRPDSASGAAPEEDDMTW